MFVVLFISALLSLSCAKNWEDILRADITCCNPVADADECSETTGGAGCVWLEYGLSDDVDNIISQSGSQCVGAEYYSCRMETSGCCAPGCDEDSSDPASAPAVAPTDEPASSLCGRGEPFPSCMLGLNYAFEGVPCQISGDPHTKTWNGGHHDFQGQPDTYTADGALKNQFYYVAPCSDMSAVDLPVTILGTHMRYRTALVSGLDYLVLELFDRMYKPSATHNIYLSSSIASYAARDTDGVSTDYDDTKADAPNALNAIEHATVTAIGDRFSALVTIDGDTTTLELTVDGENTITIFMKAQLGLQTVSSGETRYTMHYVLIQQAAAYKCASCGLCGNFKNKIDFTAETQELERCDGSMVTFQPGDDADVPEAYDPEGWTWEKNFVQNECASAGTSVQYDISGNNGDEWVFVASCDEKIQTMVDTKCEGSRNKLSSCCNSMGDMCDALLSDCRMDVCVMATIEGTGDRDLIQPAIDATLIAAIEAACAFPGIEGAFDGANIVSYEHVGCWLDDEDARAIEVSRQGLEDVEQCLDYCADDFDFFGVTDVGDSNLMCFCSNSQSEYEQYGESDICKNGAGGQSIEVVKDSESRSRTRIVTTAMDVYKITVESLTGGGDTDVDVEMLGEFQRDMVHLEPAWKALEAHLEGVDVDEEMAEEVDGDMGTVEYQKKFQPPSGKAKQYAADNDVGDIDADVDVNMLGELQRDMAHLQPAWKALEAHLEGVDVDEVDIGGETGTDDFEWYQKKFQPPTGKAKQYAEEEGIDNDIAMLQTSQQNLEVVRSNDTRWSNEPKVEHAWLLVGLLSIAIMICFAGAYRQWSSRNQQTNITEKPSANTEYTDLRDTANTAYGTNNV